MPDNSNLLHVLTEEIVSCLQCPRLVAYREKVAREKRRMFREWTYWGKPVPGFGDPQAKLLILGLAPAAHGANRTGRVFTGDRSGDFLYAALHKSGFANQPTSVRRDDGLQLKNVYIAATIRCAPPANKPLPSEIAHCRSYLERELQILQPKAILALGKIAWDAYLELLKHQGTITSRAAFPFSHGAEAILPAKSTCTSPSSGPGNSPGNTPRLFAIYHPSQQNTQTGRVTPARYSQ